MGSPRRSLRGQKDGAPEQSSQKGAPGKEQAVPISSSQLPPRQLPASVRLTNRYLFDPHPCLLSWVTLWSPGCLLQPHSTVLLPKHQASQREKHQQAPPAPSPPGESSDSSVQHPHHPDSRLSCGPSGVLPTLEPRSSSTTTGWSPATRPPRSLLWNASFPAPTQTPPSSSLLLSPAPLGSV